MLMDCETARGTSPTGRRRLTEIFSLGSAETPAVVPGSVQYGCRSESTGRDYRISVFTPPGLAPEAGYPVLYVVDANLIFPMLPRWPPVSRWRATRLS
jgi:enterochelin esterase-like enzyme